MSAKLLIGMAVYDDFYGIWPTLQAIRLYHPEVTQHLEIAVVDNNPQGQQSQTLREFMTWIKGDVVNSYYVPYNEVNGTAAPRDLVFQVGTAPYVMCIDPHVFLYPGSLKRLLDYYEQNPNTMDLLQGPMVYDDLKNFASHFSDKWEAEMWGQWQTDLKAENPDTPPFEIPAMGLGLFTCKREAWLGFNNKFKGFGGEEWYIHLKYKQRGHKTLCLPFLKWLHRFGRPGGPSYPLTKWNKVRNYVIGFQELGLDLKPVKDHFIKSNCTDPGQCLSEKDWEAIVGGQEDPQMSNTGKCGSCNKQQPQTLEEAYQRALMPGDINEHIPTLKDLASQSAIVVELAHRPGISTTALLQGKPAAIHCFGLTDSSEGKGLVKYADEGHSYYFNVGDSRTANIPACDFLFSDTIHTAEHIYAELKKHHTKVQKWIAIHDTVIFGEQGEHGGPGLMAGIRRFLLEHTEWTVKKHYRNNNGLLVLTKLGEEKKDLPPLWKQTFNVLSASWRAGQVVMKDYGPAVGTALQEERLSLCVLCESRNGDKCAECGCPVEKKTSYPTESCPLNFWKAIESK